VTFPSTEYSHALEKRRATSCRRTDLPALTVMPLGGPVRPAIAIIAIGLAVTAADRPVFAGADLRNLDAGAGRVRLPTGARLRIAPKAGRALKARNAATKFAALRDETAIGESGYGASHEQNQGNK
jgi:hypothetical protein